MAVLYRKYRPQSFGDVLNQKYIIQTLKNQLKSSSLAHAYLFTGSRGVGKTSVARILAKAANCQNLKDSEPCGKCEVCNQFAGGTFLDLVEIDAASNTGVDNIRDIIEHVKFSPSIGKYKVFIIDEVHMLSKGAFNALLKTLEEPPKHVIFILATTEIYKVPATIISRTQRFDFKRLSVQDLEQHLSFVVKEEKLKLKEEIISLVAQHAEGSVRDALSLLDKILTLGESVSLEEAQSLLGATEIKISQDLLDLILSASLEDIPEFIDALLERGVDFAVLNRDFLEYLRKVLVWKMSNGKIKPDLEKAHMERLSKAASACSINDVVFYIRLFLKSYKDLDISPSPEIPLLLAACEAAMKNHQAPVSQAKLPEIKKDKVKQPETEKAAPKAEVLQAEAPKESEKEYAPADFELPEIRVHWHEVVEHLKALNGPLATLVKSSPIVNWENGRLYLEVKFLFHKQNLENTKNQSLIGKAVEKVYGKGFYVAGVLAKPADENPEAKTSALGDALKIFGGELVE